MQPINYIKNITRQPVTSPPLVTTEVTNLCKIKYDNATGDMTNTYLLQNNGSHSCT